MQSWVSERDLYLDELVRREGRGDFTAEMCSFCVERPAGKAVFRCLECSPGPLCCRECLRERHAQLPYHRVMVRLPLRAFLATTKLIFGDVFNDSGGLEHALKPARSTTQGCAFNSVTVTDRPAGTHSQPGRTSVRSTSTAATISP